MLTSINVHAQNNEIEKNFCLKVLRKFSVLGQQSILIKTRILDNCNVSQMALKTKLDQGFADEGVVGCHAPNIVKIARKFVKVGHAAREMVTVFSVTFFSNSSWSNGQNAPLLPMEVLRPISALDLMRKMR